MNQEWSQTFKDFSSSVGKKDHFAQGIDCLLKLRRSILETINVAGASFPKEGFPLRPFPNSDGYDSKTMAYSLYHAARIEDIVVHELILHDEQVFIKGDYQRKMNSLIVTTGNELSGDEIVDFSKQIDIECLLEYVNAVFRAGDEMIRSLDFASLKRKCVEEDRKRLLDGPFVSSKEEAVWLIDYWCSKDVLGLLKMPLSRHWIMHTEAFLKIKNKIIKQKKQ